MNFIHTLNTKPLFYTNNIVPPYFRLVGTIAMSALSTCLIKQRGHNVVLHTDSLGDEFMRFIPYDEVNTTLDNIPENIHPHFFAACKMYVLENEPIDTVHIDNDVFLKKHQVFNIIENGQYDLLVQEIECNKDKQYRDWTSDLYHKHPEFINSLGITLDSLTAYNTGIINFRDKTLKDEFISRYKKIVNHYSTYTDDLDNSNKCIPDLIAEQVNLYQLSSEKYNVHPLLNRDVKPEFGKFIGYQHLVTSLKFTVIDKILDMLCCVDIDLYHKTMSVIKEIQKISDCDYISMTIEDDMDSCIISDYRDFTIYK